MKKLTILVFFIVLVSTSFTQTISNKVYVKDGILKWSASQKEVALFGINYTTPFAYSFRAINKLGLSHKQAIDMDVSQFARLELDAYRIHVWDREVSDTLGNLLDNEHLELLDYLISKLKEKNINIILTPIAWWGTGWPQPDPPSTGFSNKYLKMELITKPDARQIQKNYLKQFLNHYNKYTGFSYKDDPDIIAFEIINEPGHPADTALVTAYINEMADLIRDQGCTKPVYYNISQNWSEKQSAAVYNAHIDGISFQWYPTGLVKLSELTGNYLAHVDHYPVPKLDDPKFKNKTRMVYEFDAADIAQSVMYPAMARSFREAGMQWATMFCYDPTYLAAYNTEYNTHYINLLYTPQKAISLMIAANVFRSVKTYQQFPSYPDNLEFGDFKISYENNLSELNNGEKFYYSNNTNSKPKDLIELKHIAGFGSSPVVQSNSKGAYFIDKIADGLWRLELYPDMIKLRDPFGKNSLDRKVRILSKGKSKFKLLLPGLKNVFYAQSTRTENNIVTSVDNSIVIDPGIYILSNNKKVNTNNLKFGYYNRSLKEYPVPETEDMKLNVIQKGPNLVNENQSWKPTFTVISGALVDTAVLYLKQPGWRSYRPIGLTKTAKNIYGTEIKDNIRNGIIEYCLYVKTAAGEMTFPAKIAKNPNDWDYYGEKTWKLKIMPVNSSVTLFNPEQDNSNLIYSNVWGVMQLNSSCVWDRQNNAWLRIELSNFRKPIGDFTFQIELDNKTDSVNLSEYHFVEFSINKQHTNINEFNFQLVNSQYQSIEKKIDVSSADDIIRIPINKFIDSKITLLPQSYPHFLPATFKVVRNVENQKDQKLNFIQISIPVNYTKGPVEKKSIQISPLRLVR